MQPFTTFAMVGRFNVKRSVMKLIKKREQQVNLYETLGSVKCIIKPGSRL